ncbi:MAG: T9SS type A sorting domain-containing protein [bacterium]|jgi:hypothetical protein
MKNLLRPLIILCILITNKFSYAQHPLDFDVTVDSSCGPTINNFNVQLKNPPSNLNNITIRYQGDNGFLDISGNYTDVLIRRLRWIFFSNNGIGNFDVLVTLNDNNSSISKYITVVNGKPQLIIYSNNTNANLTKNDTLFFNNKFLTRPFVGINWYELTDSNELIKINISTEFLSLSILDNRPYKIITIAEDNKGCYAADTINITIVSTGLASSKYKDVIVKHHYENKSVSIENLIENNLQVFDISGRQIALYTKQAKESYFIKDLPSGIYIARANNYRTKIFIP